MASEVTFARFLRARRLAAGLTQGVLAERAGLSVRAISDLERGERRGPQRHTVEHLAAALGLEQDAAATFARLAATGRARRPAPPTHAGTDSRPPRAPTVLLGRDADVLALVARLTDPEARLTTLVGPGGVGKTRLALEVVAQPNVGGRATIVFVDLAPLRETSAVLSAIARALDIRERPGVAPHALLVAALRNHPTLLVLDNCEQVAAAAPDIAALLASCPGLTILATSRAALRVRGETIYPVYPLAFPADTVPTVVAALATPAVALFARAARAARPAFRVDAGNVAAVVALCRRLDGLPLALELVAARVALLPPAAILADFPAAASGAGPRDLPARQRTLHDALAWSHDLLDPAARALFRRMATLAGDADLAALRAVAGTPPAAPAPPGAFLDALAALVDLHLVARRGDGPDGAPRYGMLATVRDFAAAALAASGEGAATAARHAAHFLALAEAVAPALARGAPTAMGTFGAPAEELRAALGAAVVVGDAATALRLATALRFWWYRRGALAEGRQWFAAALRLPGTAPSGVRALALREAGRLATAAGDFAAAAQLFKAGMAALPPGAAGRTPLYQELAIVARRQGDFARARLLIARGHAAALRHRDPQGLLAATLSRAFELRARGEPGAAARAFAAVLAQARPLAAHDETIIALHHLGALAALGGTPRRARRLYAEALALARRADDTGGEAWALVRLGVLAAHVGHLGADEHLLRAVTLQEAAGDTLATIALTHDLALLAAARGEALWAARLAGAELALRAATALADPAPDRAAVRGALAGARTTVDRTVWVAAWRAGQATSPATIAPLLRAYIARLGSAAPLENAQGIAG